jgi:poly-D-alanine transfer protein DltD
MEAAARWRDLDLLLASLKAVGARPLIMDSPLKGVWWDYRGVSLGARQRFYETLDARTRSYGFTTRTFAAADSDRNFLAESRSHLSGKGWLEYDRAMNAFVHDSLH